MLLPKNRKDVPLSSQLFLFGHLFRICACVWLVFGVCSFFLSRNLDLVLFQVLTFFCQKEISLHIVKQNCLGSATGMCLNYRPDKIILAHQVMFLSHAVLVKPGWFEFGWKKEGKN